MVAARQAVNMGFTDETFPDGTHMCFIYSDETERRKVISKFVQSGLALGDHVSYFADSMPPEEVRKWLREMGVAVPADETGGHFALATAEHAYCPHGKFVPDDLFDGFRDHYRQAMANGHAGVRMTGEMSWALKGMPGSERLMEYEAMATEVSVTVPVISLCQYNANLFDGATIMNALKVHPMMVVHGQIVRNPYFVNPRDFLKDHGYRR